MTEVYDPQWQCLHASSNVGVETNKAHSYNGLVLTSGSKLIADALQIPGDRGIFSFKVSGILRDNATKACSAISITAACPTDDEALYEVPEGSSAFINVEVIHVDNANAEPASYALFATVPMVDLSGAVYDPENLPDLSQCLRNWLVTGADNSPAKVLTDLVINAGEVLKIYHDSGWMSAFLMGFEYNTVSGLYTALALAPEDLSQSVWGDLYTCPTNVVFFGKLILVGAMECSVAITAPVLEGYGIPDYDGGPMPIPS